MLLVLLTACAGVQTWPVPCPGAFHPSEALYALALKQYNVLKVNFTSTRQRKYSLAFSEYQTKWPAYERGVQTVDARFWQLLLLRGVVTPLKRDIYGRLPRDMYKREQQQQSSWDIDLLGEHDEKLYWEAIRALGPKPVLPVLQPYHLIDITGVELLAILAAHARRVAAWQANTFDKRSAFVVFGKLHVKHNTRTLTAVRDAFAITGLGVCNRGPIPSRAQFAQLYNETCLRA